MVYQFIRFVAWMVMRLAFRLKVKDIQNVPERGPVIIAANHASYLDPILAGCAIRRQTYYLARHTLFHIPLLNVLMRLANAFPVRRGHTDLSAFKKALGVLKKGHVLVMFPEGTRTRTGELQPAEPGLGMVASASGATVVPAFVSGSWRAMRRGVSWPRFVEIQVKYGKPISVSRVPKVVGKRRHYQQISDIVMDGIRKLADDEEKCGDSGAL